MELTYMELREQICDICHKMWQLGWVAANDGNVSVKLPDGTFLATPTGMSKSFITPEKLVHIDQDGQILDASAGLNRPRRSRCICAVIKSGRMWEPFFMLTRLLQPGMP